MILAERPPITSSHYKNVITFYFTSRIGSRFTFRVRVWRADAVCLLALLFICLNGVEADCAIKPLIEVSRMIKGLAALQGLVQGMVPRTAL